MQSKRTSAKVRRYRPYGRETCGPPHHFILSFGEVQRYEVSWGSSRSSQFALGTNIFSLQLVHVHSSPRSGNLTVSLLYPTAYLVEMRYFRDCFKAINLYLYDIIFVTNLIGEKTMCYYVFFNLCTLFLFAF